MVCNFPMRWFGGRGRRVVAMLLLAGSLLGCASDEGGKDVVTSPPDPVQADDSGTPGSGASDGATRDDDGMTPEPEPEPEPDTAVRFVVLGDGGEGNAAQYAVAEAVRKVCEARKCQFALYLGDNFYDEGVSSVDDPQFQTKFEMPYANLDMPFYVVLGNHDYGALGFDFDKLEYEVEYSKYSDKWTLPAPYYDVRHGDVHLFGIDTTRYMWDRDRAEQTQWLHDAMSATDARWRIVFGHHPHVSNGSHGNAGNYEGVSWPSQVSGTHVKTLMDEEICGHAHVYFSGHDHNRQWLKPVCGTEFIVSGAAAKNTPFKHRDNNEVYFEEDEEPGFMWVEIDGDRFVGAFYDQDGNLDYEGAFTR